MENHLPALVSDLALILGAGAVITLIFKKIRQPLVLGYIIAGFLVGPYFAYIPTVQEEQSIKIWAEIGVIFLLFSLGLEFSFKKLLHVGGSASITAIVEIVSILILGYFVGQWMGWSTMNSIFLGGLLASSSTTIILRAFDELGVKRKNFAGVVFGVLIVEDIVVILLMVLLSTMAVSQQFNGGEMLFSSLRLVFFLALWFISGIFLIPTLLRRLKKILDEETLLILAIGLCLGMVVLATKIGFSAELGAFVMGSILAETMFAEKIEHSLKSVKDLFGAVFFVSIGMMIDPASMYEYRWEILAITLLTIFGKLFFTSLGALISGQPLKQSLQVGMSMAQIGEFAFIVASLGMSLKVTSDFLFPIAVGVSAITTFTTPYMIKYSDLFYQVVRKYTPVQFVKAIDKYSSDTQNIREESKWKILTKSYLSLILANGIVAIGLVLIMVYLIQPFIHDKIGDDNIIKITLLIITILACAPFIWALMVKKPANGIFGIIWNENKYSRGPLVVLEIVRILIGILLLGFILNMIYSGIIASLVVIPVVVLGIYLLSTKFRTYYTIISKRFIFNLNERDIKKKEEKKQTRVKVSKLLPWDSHITDFEVNPNASYVGHTLSELAWREKFGINIAYIKRGDNVIPVPTEEDKIFPFDKLGVLGTDNQIRNFEESEEVNDNNMPEKTFLTENVVLTKFILSKESQLSGRTVKYLREATGGLVVGIENIEGRVLNPASKTILKAGNMVWIVGNKKEIQEYIQKAES